MVKITMVFTDDQKIKYLNNLIKKYYTQGDYYYVRRNQKDNWVFGYLNDYPLQHGPGESFSFTDKMVETLMKISGYK